MTRSQGIGLAIFIFYTLAATITIVTVILSTSKTESNDDTFSPNETMTISKDDNENSTNILVPVVTIPHNWAKEDSDINNDFTDSTTYSATITSTPLSTTTTAATSTTTTTATASTLSTTTIPTNCCSPLNLTLGHDFKNTIQNDYEGVYTFDGFINGMDYWIHDGGEYAIWFWYSASGEYYWLIGPKSSLGLNTGGMYATLDHLKKKCPNNEGWVWSWKYTNSYAWVATDDVYLKCMKEDDLCSVENPCGMDEGDCDIHDECQDGLACGSNNCLNSIEYSSDDQDCCYNATIGDEHFCTTFSPCGENEGDCDSNDECHTGLSCDIENGCSNSTGFNSNVACCTNQKVCQKNSWIGDSFCDDITNNEECEWDGGDCCGDNVNTDYCTLCLCLDTIHSTSTTTTTLISSANNTSQSDATNKCVYSAFDFQQRIVGGVSAASPIPWQVQIVVDNSWICGGTILDNSTILSAAHCYENDDTPSYVRAGSVKFGSGGQVRSVVQNIWNQDLVYNQGGSENNDWIILKLNSPLNFNDDVQATCLPTSSNWSPESDPNNRCFVSGWGTLEYEGNSPDNLQWVEVPAVTNAVCRQESYGSKITDSMICGGYSQGGKDACQGDSGGPFVCLDGNNAILTGIVSWGVGCARPGYYGVYARVTKILDWIRINMI